MSVLLIKNFRIALSKNGQIPLTGFENGELCAVKSDKNEPISWFGSSSIVFKLTDGKNNYGLKCFITELNGRWIFLKNVKQKLDAIKNNSIVSFEILENALLVQDDQKTQHKISVILMPWVEGERLQDIVSTYCKNNNVEGIRKLCCSFVDLAINQINQPYSHGDINPANIMVKGDGTMMLIDHDTMGFADTINASGVSSWSLGYQHPYRHPNYVDLHVDDFPFLLITISLKALEHNPALFHRFNTSKGLLFTIDDLKRPWASSVIEEIGKIEDPYLKSLLNILHLSLVKPVIEIEGLLKYLSGDISAEEENELSEAVSKQNEKFEQGIKYVPEHQPVNITLPVDEDGPELSSYILPEKLLSKNTPLVYHKRRSRIKHGVFAALLMIIILIAGIKYYLPGNALVVPVNYEEFTKLPKEEKNDFTKGLSKTNQSLNNEPNIYYVDNSAIAEHRKGSSIEQLKSSIENENVESPDAVATRPDTKPTKALKPAAIKTYKKSSPVKPKRVYDVEFRKLVY
jgi:hypothetical protein